MFKRLVRHLLLAPVVLVLLFEEWGWAPLAALFARLARLPLWAWLERRIAALPPYGALLLYGLVLLTLLPVKLLALYLFGRGDLSLGVGLLLAAKVLGTALLARLFQLTQPALMRLAWFAHWYPRWEAWKNALLARVRQSVLWRRAQQFKARVVAQARVWWAGWR